MANKKSRNPVLNDSIMKLNSETKLCNEYEVEFAKNLNDEIRFYNILSESNKYYDSLSSIRSDYNEQFQAIKMNRRNIELEEWLDTFFN